MNDASIGHACGVFGVYAPGQDVAHLTYLGLFARISGIVLGEFTGCEEKDADYTSADVLRELAMAVGVPCAAGFPIGHGAVNEPVPLGARVRLDADAPRLTFLEGAVQL